MTRNLRHGPWLSFIPMLNEVTNINTLITSAEDLEAERRYRLEERLGILIGADVPTDDQLSMAIKEADDWVLEFIKTMP